MSRTTTYSGADVVVGSKWRHKRDRGRVLTVTGIDSSSVDVRYVDVRRNTSRRRQPVLLTTLLRDYRPWREAARG